MKKLHLVVFIFLLSFLLLAAQNDRQSYPPTKEETTRTSRAAQALSAAQKTNVENAIISIEFLGMLNGGTFAYQDANGNTHKIDSKTIAAGLEKQLKDGRIKVNPTMDPKDYAVTTTDGKTSDSGDQVELQPSLVDGGDETFLEEVLVHEYMHKLQATGTRAEREIEAYSLEKDYKDKVGVASTNAHYKECVENLAYFQAQTGSTGAKKKNRSSHIDVNGVHYQVTLADPSTGSPSQLIYFTWGDADTVTEIDLTFNAGDIIAPTDNLLIISGGTYAGEGAIQHVEILPGELFFHPIMTFPELSPGFLHHIDYDETDPTKYICLDTEQQRVVKLLHDPDWWVESFFDVFVQIDLPHQPVYRMEWATPLDPTIGEGLILDDVDHQYDTMRKLDEPISIFLGMDGITYYDTYERDYRELTPVIQNPLPYPGNNMVNVFGTLTHELQICEVINYDPDTGSFDLGATLGTMFLVIDNDELVPLTRPLVEGEYITVMDFTTGEVQQNPYQVPIMDDIALLRVGDWLNPQEWHDWFSVNDGLVDIQLHIDDPDNFINTATFRWSLDQSSWNIIDTVLDANETPEDTYGDITDLDPGWFTQLDMGDWTVDSFFDVFFDVQIDSDLGPVTSATTVREFDPLPPDAVQITNLDDWQFVPDSFFDITYDIPANYNILSIKAKAVAKVDSFWKGVPEINQREVSDHHCAPTAAAACLEWFEAQGDNDICGGYDGTDLVRELAKYCKTSSSGTKPSNLAKGLKDWIEDHGDDYTVRGPKDMDWKEMRNEVERGQDVLSGIYWPGGGGHRMTMNSFKNKALDNGNYKIDFMDPWEGTIGWGELDPDTGNISGFTGQSGNSGQLDKVIIVCPEEQDANDPANGGQQIDNPQPGNNTLHIDFPHRGLYFIHSVIINSNGNSQLITKVVDNNPPIENIEIVYIDNSVLISWPGQETEQFNVYSSTEPDTGFSKIQGASPTYADETWTYTEPASDKKFYYVVRVID
ncbi:MAG: hypothetical protein K9G38_05225 [Bacteroidales bacterium]|nr:hypothetical protein [Bacteroidales bacterium]